MTPLALSGRVLGLSPREGSDEGSVIRLRDPGDNPRHLADAALIRSSDDAEQAAANGFSAAVGVGIDGSLISEFGHWIALDHEFAYLADGDILGTRPRSQSVRTLYRPRSKHNAFLVTERCNHWCLMCSQPPRKVVDDWIIKEIRDCLPLIDPIPRSLGFTGGEPLLNWQSFVSLLDDTMHHLPDAALHVLTNGRSFADPSVVAAWAGLRHPHLTAAIPIYSAVAQRHDYVVQSQHAFDETIMGILRLKDRGQRVEIRIVLHALTVDRLVETATWLARNLPFVDHVALMGLEYTGFALANEKVLHVDPRDYKDELTAAVVIMQSVGLRVSVYNLPLCMISRTVWPAAVKSISDWKNGFVAACSSCAVRERCPGFFSSGKSSVHADVQPIKESDIDVRDFI